MVEMTQAAVAHVKKVQEESGEENACLRIQVVGGGCSGFNYEMYFDNERSEDDMVFETEGVQLLVDPVSYEYLKGTQIDFMQRSAYEAGFVFNNPNANQSCGCGKSFSA